MADTFDVMAYCEQARAGGKDNNAICAALKGAGVPDETICKAIWPERYPVGSEAAEVLAAKCRENTETKTVLAAQHKRASRTVGADGLTPDERQAIADKGAAEARAAIRDGDKRTYHTVLAEKTHKLACTAKAAAASRAEGDGGLSDGRF